MATIDLICKINRTTLQVGEEFQTISNISNIVRTVQIGEEGAGTVEKVWGGRFTDLRFSLSFDLIFDKSSLIHPLTYLTYGGVSMQK